MMASLFDLLGFKPGKSPYHYETTNLTQDQQIKLHQARSLCGLLVYLSDPVSDVPMSFSVDLDNLGGVAWLLRDLLDEVGKMGETAIEEVAQT